MSRSELKKEIIPRFSLERIAEARLREGKALLAANEFSGAVYLAGYSVECYLKAAICARLEWDSLRATFKTHDLETLLLYTGLQRRLKEDIAVWLNFRKIVGLWNGVDGNPKVRYDDPDSIDELTAKAFLSYLEPAPEGVIPWLQKAIS